jgi:hypothetical protein
MSLPTVATSVFCWINRGFDRHCVLLSFPRLYDLLPVQPSSNLGDSGVATCNWMGATGAGLGHAVWSNGRCGLWVELWVEYHCLQQHQCGSSGVIAPRLYRSVNARLRSCCDFVDAATHSGALQAMLFLLSCQDNKLLQVFSSEGLVHAHARRLDPANAINRSVEVLLSDVLQSSPAGRLGIERAREALVALCSEWVDPTPLPVGDKSHCVGPTIFKARQVRRYVWVGLHRCG